ncbi:MAG: DUF3429 domain-containing protein [Woeseiaceae bacterium]|nr:DUF3429 domain-containing protein [Woeseiaceae bacterium]
MEDRPVYSALILAGALPFLACALLPAAGVESFGRLGSLHELAATYGLAILCFLTGIHWATQLYHGSPLPINLFIGSNVVFLAVLLAYVASSLKWALATQLIAYPLLLLLDYQLLQKGLISQHYLGMRFIATAVACFSILFILTSG